MIESDVETMRNENQCTPHLFKHFSGPIPNEFTGPEMNKVLNTCYDATIGRFNHETYKNC